MSYLHDGMPPVIRITSENADGTINWQLESQQGDVVETYTTEGISNPQGWWDDMATALLASENRAEAAFGLLRYNAMNDHEIIDER